MLLDFDPQVSGFSSQPFWLAWSEAGRTQRHAPDYFARLTDGTGVVIDVRPNELVDDRAAKKFAQTQNSCEQVGWQYRRLGTLPRLKTANLRWIAGYHHPRYFDRGLAVRLMEIFVHPTELFTGAEHAGDRLAVLPVLYHLLWRQVLRTDLETSRLNHCSLVRWERA